MKRRYHKDDPCDASVHIRMPKQELDSWKEEASKSGMSLSRYVRRCVSGRTIEIVINTPIEIESISEIAAEYGKIGSNINQIAHYLNSGLKFSGSMYNRLSDAIDEMGEVTRKLAEEVEKINGNHKAQGVQRIKL